VADSERLWREVVELLNRAPMDDAKRAWLVSSLRAHPEAWPSFIEAMRESGSREGA